MESITRLCGIAAPLDRANVDTDAIIPKQFLKSIRRSGFGKNLFDEWRYTDYGEPDQDCDGRPLRADFVLNHPVYAQAKILLVRENFGCGSSREHAVWALLDFGIRCVVGPSFADIFYSNCGKNGLLAAILAPAAVDELFQAAAAHPAAELCVDLLEQTVSGSNGETFPFKIDSAIRERLLAGLDDIGITLQYADAIRAYERQRAERLPWL